MMCVCARLSQIEGTACAKALGQETLGLFKGLTGGRGVEIASC